MARRRMLAVDEELVERVLLADEVSEDDGRALLLASRRWLSRHPGDWTDDGAPVKSRHAVTERYLRPSRRRS